MKELVQHLINGVQVGGIYALVALGYTMVYGIIRLINFAHGDFIMVGAYTSIVTIPFLVSAGLPAWLCIFAAVPVCAALGVLTERAAYRPLRSSPPISALITAIGVSLFLENVFMLIFGAAPKPFPTVITLPPIDAGDFSLSGTTWMTIAVSVAVMLALEIFVKKTKTGQAMRAVSENPDAAVLMGISADRTISVTFLIGSALAAVASFFYCSAYALVNPYMGTMLGLKAFIAAVLGGIGSIPGAMLGGFLIGLAESFSKAYISSQLSDAVVFGILIIVLLVKPSGILGRNIGEKV